MDLNIMYKPCENSCLFLFLDDVFARSLSLNKTDTEDLRHRILSSLLSYSFIIIITPIRYGQA